MTLGERIREARLSLGLTQDGLAKPDLTKGFISQVERNATRPSVASLERLAERLNKPISYLLANDHTPLSRKILETMATRGRAALLREQYDAARAAYQEMRDLAASCGNARMEMYAVLGLGEAVLGLRQLVDARASLTDALERGRTAKDLLVECRALHGLATVEHRTGAFARAESLYRAALAIGPALSEPDLHGEIWHYLGTVLQRMGRFEESFEAFGSALRIFDGAARHERVGPVLVSYGAALYHAGDYDGALIQLERGRALLERYEDLRTLSWARNNIGLVLLDSGKPRDAQEHFTISLAIKRRLQDAVGESHTLTELGRCALASGDPERAREYAEQAIARSRNGGAPDEEARAQIVLAAIAMGADNTRKARRYLASAAEYCERASMATELVTALRLLARVAASEHRHKEAAACTEKVFVRLSAMLPHDAAAAVRTAAHVDHWIDTVQLSRNARS